MSSQEATFRSSFKTVLLLAAFGIGQMPAALASPFPGTGAPLLEARQMAPEKGGDPTNPFSYPILKDLAKSLARNGFPASFFLGLDSHGGPGIDLRTILLYEAGVLKSPVKLNVPAKRKKPDIPLLSVGEFPESSGKMPSEAPKLEDPESLGPSGMAGVLGSASASELKPGDSQLSVDLNKFASEGTPKSSKKHRKERLAEHFEGSPRDLRGPDVLDSVAMMQPMLSLSRPTSTEENSFRFWTVPQPIASPERATTQAPYVGSYVMASPLGLKAVEGRKFVLTAGHVLVSSGGKPLEVATPMAKVSIGAGATAYVEIVKPGLSRIRVIETKPGAQGVSLKYDADGKASETNLAAGEDFLVADHSLADADKALQSKPESGTAGNAANWSKSTFLPHELLEADKFFSTDNPQQNPEQRSAMLDLRGRLK